MSLKAEGRSLWVYVTCHYSGIICECCDDDVVSGWYVSPKYQLKEGTQHASLGYYGMNWKVIRGLHIIFYLRVTICEVGF